MTDGDGIQRGEQAESDARLLVTAHRTAPGRTVLTERGNVNAWIASDLTVDTVR